VTINVSDLAAASAKPLAFVCAVEAPATLEIEKLERLIQGIAECCASEGIEYVGGNLREASIVAVNGTAIGECPHGRPARRSGASVNDLVVSVGGGGVFWRDAMLIRKGIAVDKRASPVYSPVSQWRVLHELGKEGLISAAMDNSDGLLPTLMQIAASSKVRILCDLGALTVDHTPYEPLLQEIDPCRFWLGWGDWNVICTCKRGDVGALMVAAARCGGLATVIGECVSGDGVYLKRGGRVVPAPRLESERFAVDSWFEMGVETYLSKLLCVELPS
ncbi:MAG: thiamine-phosphate kinase, partial [Aureliella sp.]